MRCRPATCSASQSRFVKTQKLDPSLPGAGTVLRDGIWRFELNNEELFPGEGEKSFDASAYKMRSVLQGYPGEKLTLEYDYGDGWEIEVTLETILGG